MPDIEKWDYFALHINFEENKTDIQNSQKASEKLGDPLVRNI